MNHLLYSGHWNERGRRMTCRSLSVLPAETIHLSASWCTAASCPAPPYVGLASRRRPTFQPCPSSWCCQQRGQQCSEERGDHQRPSTREASATALCGRALRVTTCDLGHRGCRNGLPNRPSRKELRCGICQSLQWGGLKAGQLPPSPSQNWIWHCKHFLKSRSATTIVIK